MINKRVLEKLSELTALSAFFLTPLVFFTQTRDQFELPKLTFLAVLGSFLLFLNLAQGRRLGFSALHWALLALLACQAHSSLPSNSLSWTTSLLGDYENFGGLSSSLTLFIWFLALTAHAPTLRTGKITHFALLSALLSSFYAIGQHYGYDFIPWNPDSVITSREFGSLGNPNFLAAYLAMALPFLLLRIQPEARRAGAPILPYCVLALVGLFLLLAGTEKGSMALGLSPDPNSVNFPAFLGLGLLGLSLAALTLSFPLPSALLSLPVLALGLVATGSRGGFLGALAGAAVAGFFLWRDREARQRFLEGFSRVSKPILYSAAAIALAGIGYFGQGFLNRFFHSLLNAGDSLAASRLHIWKPSLEMIRSNLLDGVGLDTFKIAFPAYSGFEFNAIDGVFVSSRTAHNELLQIAATTGLPGLAAYLALLVSFTLLWLGAYQKAQPGNRWILAALLASALAYQVQNIFSFGVAAINLLWFFILAAVSRLSSNSAWEGNPDPPSFPAGRRLLTCLLFILCLLLSTLSLARLAADSAFARGAAILDYLKKPNRKLEPSEQAAYGDLALGYMARAADLFNLEVKYRLYQGLAYEQRAAGEGGDWNLKALEAYGRAVAMSPANAYYYNNLGRVHAKLAKDSPSHLSQSEDFFGRAVRLAPSSPYFLVQWALSLRKTGNRAQAEEALRRAFTLSPDFAARTVAQLAVMEYQEGRPGEGMDFLDHALKGNSLSAEMRYYRGILLLREGKKKKARADLKEAQRLNPKLESIDELISQSR